MTQSPHLIEHLEVEPPTTPRGTIIWLHGLGADAQDFAPMVTTLNFTQALPIRFIFPNAPMRPITINNGYVMRAWYDITSMSKIEGHLDTAGIDISVQQIHQFIAHEIARGIPAEKIILAGFSQGALIALTAGLRYPAKLAGVLALSGYLPYSAESLSKTIITSARMPIFLGHGTEDTVVPYLLSLHAHEMLKRCGYTTTFKSYPVAHTVCPEEVADIKTWISQVYA